MKDNSSEKIRRRIRSSKQGRFFILNDFLDITSRNTAKVELNKLVNEGKLIRPYNGIYQKPKINKKFNFKVPPTTHEIARQIARKNNQQIAPAGDTALNLLGLSTQVPAIYEYITNGPSRKIKISRNQIVIFKHSGTKKFINDNADNTMIFETLHFLKFDELDDHKLKILSNNIDRNRYNQLSNFAKGSTEKVRNIIDKMGEYINA
ncbi:DUF6088 family protein (plasmid) [Weissella paramesenteroides]|jgi:hypothetical protein|uniref:DUF6088 family protein n=1 Tax=Weissella paramesenteroides TaxID=1249 RepID=UPI003857234B